MTENLNEPLYNSRIISTYLRLIREKYKYVNISELLDYAGIKRYEVEDEAHWFNQIQVDRFHEKLQELSGVPDIAREAGRFGASPTALGAMRHYVLGLVDPANAYAMLGKTIPKFSKSSVVKVSKVSSNQVEIVVTPKKGVVEKPYQCENRIGYIEAVSLGFNHRLPKVEHPECIFKGGRSCRYVVSWRPSRAASWRRNRNYFAFLLGCVCLGALPIASLPTFSILSSVSIVVVLLMTLYAEVLQKRELRTAVTHLRGSTDKLLEQININYNNALLINELGQAISKQTKVDEILEEVMRVFEKRVDFDRGMVLLANQEKTRLKFRAGFGYTDGEHEFLVNTTFRLDKPDSKGIFVMSVRERKPFLVDNIQDIIHDLSPHSQEFVKKMRTKSFICCPIVFENEALGVFAVDNIRTRRPFVQSDVSFLMGIAMELGIGIHNAHLLEIKECQFRCLLQTLAASIDARDPLTAGHSETVTGYAVGICEELGLSPEYCEMIRVAALLHDYGKIGVPDTILKKKGDLSPEERREIETHAAKTKKLLEQIHFDGIYSQIPMVAGAHHERIDGSGYPLGLKGDEIPLGARIIAVADVFEALTARRHYRNPMPVKEAFKIIEKSKGVHFDAEIVDAFFRYYRKNNGNELI